MKSALRVLVAAFLLAIAATATFIYAGVYNVAATVPHHDLTYHVLHYAMKRAVAVRADSIRPPQLNEPQRVRDGLALYRAHCVQCHGAPGVAPDALGLGLTPAPANLVEAAREWPATELYWVVRHGIKMTAMPAWEYRFSDRELWDMVAFLKAMTAWSPAQYRAISAATPDPAAAPMTVAAPRNGHELGNPQAGLRAISQYMCATCHSIPGAAGDSNVGPPLDGMARRGYIGGVLRNTPHNMVRWLLDPQQIDPQSAMPNLRLREQDARDIAAYLYTLGKRDAAPESQPAPAAKAGTP
jgi:mono/diheme cytochrome c family protein